MLSKPTYARKYNKALSGNRENNSTVTQRERVIFTFICAQPTTHWVLAYNFLQIRKLVTICKKTTCLEGSKSILLILSIYCFPKYRGKIILVLPPTCCCTDMRSSQALTRGTKLRILLWSMFRDGDLDAPVHDVCGELKACEVCLHAFLLSPG